MNTILVTTTFVLSGAACLGAVGCIVRRRVPDFGMLGIVAALELSLIALTVATLISAGSSARQIDTASMVGYLLTLLIIVPAGFVWSLVEQTNYGTAVIIVVGLAVPVMVLRTQQIWDVGSVA